jgi:hypothetical protein
MAVPERTHASRGKNSTAPAARAGNRVWPADGGPSRTAVTRQTDPSVSTVQRRSARERVRIRASFRHKSRPWPLNARSRLVSSRPEGPTGRGSIPRRCNRNVAGHFVLSLNEPTNCLATRKARTATLAPRRCGTGGVGAGDNGLWFADRVTPRGQGDRVVAYSYLPVARPPSGWTVPPSARPP